MNKISQDRFLFIFHYASTYWSSGFRFFLLRESCSQISALRIFWFRFLLPRIVFSTIFRDRKRIGIGGIRTADPCRGGKRKRFDALDRSTTTAHDNFGGPPRSGYLSHASSYCLIFIPSSVFFTFAQFLSYQTFKIYSHIKASEKKG